MKKQTRDRVVPTIVGERSQFHSQTGKSAGLGEPSNLDANYPEKPIRPCAFATWSERSNAGATPFVLLPVSLDRCELRLFFHSTLVSGLLSPPDAGLDVIAKRAVQLSWFPASRC
jgi:hypothetical protein